MARKDQGGGERPRIAAEGARIVGVQLNQPGYLLFGVRMNGRSGSTRQPIRAIVRPAKPEDGKRSRKYDRART